MKNKTFAIEIRVSLHSAFQRLKASEGLSQNRHLFSEEPGYLLIFPSTTQLVKGAQTKNILSANQLKCVFWITASALPTLMPSNSYLRCSFYRLLTNSTRKSFSVGKQTQNYFGVCLWIPKRTTRGHQRNQKWSNQTPMHSICRCLCFCY